MTQTMTATEIQSEAVTQRLRAVVAEVLGADPREITDEASQLTLPEWTSLGHLTLMAAVEGLFGLRFTMEEMTSATDFPRLRQLVERHLAASRG